MVLAGLGRGFKNKVQHHREAKKDHIRQNELQDERDKLAAQLEAKDRPVAIDEIEARDATGQRLTH